MRAARVCRVDRFSISTTARMSGERKTSRIIIEAFASLFAKAAAVKTGSPTDGSLTVSKNLSRFADATVNSPAVGTVTGIAEIFPVTTSGAEGSGRIV